MRKVFPEMRERYNQEKRKIEDLYLSMHNQYHMDTEMRNKLLI